MAGKYLNLFILNFLLVFTKFAACSSFQKMGGFIVNLVRTRSPECSIVFIWKNVENWDGLITGVMSNLRLIPYYNAAFYNLPGKSYATNFSIVTITQNQKAATCKMAVVMIEDIRTEFLEQIRT